MYGDASEEGVFLRFGFIGTGSMGSMLIQSFLQAQEGGISIIACNRSAAKIEALSRRFPLIQVKPTPHEVAAACDFLFLCVKPADAWPVLQEISPYLREQQFFASLLSSLSLQELEDILPCRVIKMIPSITQLASSGIILTMYGSRLSPAEVAEVEKWFTLIGKPYPIAEKDTRICADLTSCGPAFISFLLLDMARAAVRQGGIHEETAAFLLCEMIHGLGKLLSQGELSLEGVIRRVSVPGGITEAGLQTLSAALHGVFDQLFISTQKHSHSSPPQGPRP